MTISPFQGDFYMPYYIYCYSLAVSYVNNTSTKCEYCVSLLHCKQTCKERNSLGHSESINRHFSQNCVINLIKYDAFLNFDVCNVILDLFKVLMHGTLQSEQREACVQENVAEEYHENSHPEHSV